MTGIAVVDTNLLMLLVVGSASKEYVAKHKRLTGYSVDDFDLLGLVLTEFSEIVLLPHILAEVSSLVRHIGNPARAEILTAFRTLIATAPELPLQSSSGAQREDFHDLGLTDAVILHLCDMAINGIGPTLITSDSKLANRASSLGYSVIDYREEYQAN